MCTFPIVARSLQSHVFLRMQVTLQTLNGDKHELRVLSSDTVTELKLKVQSNLELMQASEITVIHQGKVLNDGAQTLAAAGVVDQGCLIILKQRKKAAKGAKVV